MKTLRELRTEMRLSQYRFAQLLQLSPICYAGYEKCPQLIPYPIAVRIAALTGEPLDGIFFG